ncbi:Conserved hypothetical, protein [Geosmithia morbida]|uniref:Conserved hypothetical, protein n=1 Tax=Geosmithia morbida TaxID=1094350 RepID=A0A9P5D885_9HYPO|nr:Conserved hypothetical, protein [Geosmithia morbida]KAF4126530.1 Conserved hypothetical, protein [Geosmithia morbida]
MRQDDGLQGTSAPPPRSGAAASAADRLEPATEQGEEDEFNLIEGYETASTGSTSVTSSIYAHTYENGRRYAHFKNGRYPIPNDDQEQDREDMKHAMFMELMDGQLFYAPIGDDPRVILDVGTGTGLWAIDAGDRFPGARVRGIDLAPIQPAWVPPNVDFLVDDFENDFITRDCDLIHFRFIASILKVKTVPAILGNAYQALKPGGWIEMQELCGAPLCDDGTMPDDDPVKKMYDLAAQAFARFDADVRLASDLGTHLREAGFENVKCIVKKVPIGVWAKDKTLRLIGLYQKTAILQLMPALAGRPFEALGMAKAESEIVLSLARKGLEDTGAHRYFNYYFWYAQKPGAA